MLWTVFWLGVSFVVLYILWPYMDRTRPPAERRECAPLNAVVLLGDSMLDNETYVDPETAFSVSEQLARAMQITVYRAAVDGAIMEEVKGQLLGMRTCVPEEDCRHRHLAVLSAGGNNGLQALSRALFTRTLRPVFTFIWNFSANYEQMLLGVLEQYPRTVALNIYVPNSKHFILRIFMAPFIRILNGMIHRVCRRHHVPVIDVFTLFNNEDDYANAIEPNAQGGFKIMSHIAHVFAQLECRNNAHWIERSFPRLQAPLPEERCYIQAEFNRRTSLVKTVSPNHAETVFVDNMRNNNPFRTM